MLTGMFLSAVFIYRHTNRSVLDHFEMEATDEFSILEGLQLLVNSAMYERSLPEKVDVVNHPPSQLFWSNLGLIILFSVFMFGYLYKKLPYSMIPNWIPLIGKAEEFVATAFQGLAVLGMGGII